MQNSTYEPIDISKKIVHYCLKKNKRFVFISGNGGSGKTELSILISKKASKHGHVNVVRMDDFVVDTKLRNSATLEWNDSVKGLQSGSIVYPINETIS